MAVKGLDKLLKQLKALPAEQVKAARESLAQGAEEVAEAVRRAAPRRTGALAKSVGWAKGDAPATRATGALRAGSTDGEAGAFGKALGDAGLKVTVYAGDDEAYYARFVEFGTRAAPAGRYKDHNGKTRTNKAPHQATAAQPFFYPTVRALKKRVKSRIVRNANRAAKAAAALKTSTPETV